MNSQELSKILQIIKTDEAARKHFFRKLESAKNPMLLLKPLKDEGYFDGIKNPEPIENPEDKGRYSIPYWVVLGFLDNVSKQNGKKPDEEINTLLLEIIDSITTYINPTTGQRVDNYHTDRYILKIISNLPINCIIEKHIRLIDTFLRTKFSGISVASEIKQTILAKLVKHRKKELLLILLNIILDFNINPENRINHFKPLMDKYWLRDTIEKYKNEIAKICAPEAANIAIQIMEKILKINKNEFNFISIPSIEDHEQNWRADSYEFQLVFFIRDMLGPGKSIKVKPIIEKMLKNEHPIFKRLGLFGINKHYRDLKELFWNWKRNPLDNTKCKRELYRLIEVNCENFNETEINKFLHWITSKTYKNETDEKHIAYRKKEWLLPFKKKKKYRDHKKINKLYEDYNNIESEEIKHPGWLSWHETTCGHVDAFDEKVFFTKTSKEQVDFLNNYQFKKGWRKPKPNDVAYKLQKIVAEQPQRFAENMMKFSYLERKNDKLALLGGLKDAWEKGKDFEWEEVFEFCKNILKAPNFWTEKYDKNNYNYRRAFIQKICDLLIAGTCNDSHAFDEKLFPKTENLLLKIGYKTRKISDEFPESESLSVTEVINSTTYAIFSAIIHYALRYARIYSKENNSKWPEKIRDFVEVGLDKIKEPSLYYSETMGLYLENLVYLDKEWVWTNIDRIFPKENESHWRAAFRGYLSMEKVYKHIYLLLKKHGHYEKAIETNFADEYGNKYVVQHVCIGYLVGDEILEDAKGLISQLVKKDDPTVIGNIIEFMHTSNGADVEEFSNKIKLLWSRLYELLDEKKDNSEYANIIRELCSWLDKIEKIDENVSKWVKFSIDHIKEYWDSYDFPAYLSKHISKTPEAAGELYMYMLDRGYCPDYDRESIQKIVEVLYEKQLKEKADEICRLYQVRGHEFLKNIYEKNNPQTSW